MNDTTDLKKLERKVFRTIIQDGFYDIFFGLFFLTFAFSIFIRDILLIPFGFLFYPIFFSIDFLILFYGKRKITMPRIGYVQFREERRIKLRKMKKIILIIIPVSLLIFFLSIIRIIPPELHEYELGAVIANFCFMAIPIALLGYFLDYPRFYLIALAGGISLSLSELSFTIWNDLYIEFFTFFLSGSILTLSGIIMLYRFLNKYKIKKKGGNNGRE